MPKVGLRGLQGFISNLCSVCLSKAREADHNGHRSDRNRIVKAL